METDKKIENVNLWELLIKMLAIKSLLLALKTKDKECYKHSMGVKSYAEAIAKEMKLSPYLIKVLGYSALLHDVDKIRLSEKVSQKNKELSHPKKRKNKKYLMHKEKMHAYFAFLKAMIKTTKQHDEEHYAIGSTEDLSGEDVLLASHILIVADAIDAINSNLYSHEIISKRKACSMIREIAEIKSNSEVMKVLTRMFNMKKYENKINNKQN